MKYSFNWLKELSGTKRTAQKVREDLTMRAFEVEGLEEIGNGFTQVVTGRIESIAKHPDADRLQIVRVVVDSKGKDVRQIVCGAHNIKIGDIVPVALPGAKLPNGMEIKEAKLRGVESAGMLCAEDELELGTDHSGILILKPGTAIGQPFSEYLGIESDSILEIKVLPDRAHDAMSHVGVAREIAALEKREFDYDFDGLSFDKKSKQGKSVQVRIESDRCRRYVGVVMKNVEIKESPSWMKNRLKASGIRPINNVVDATNYVMLELGNPLHAFDLDKIGSGKEIVVRQAGKDEKLRLLDGNEIGLATDDLLITNGNNPLALAGVMGGEHSGISESTKDIFLEAASFDPVMIRKTRTRLGLQTDSSSRFEKDIDPNLAEKAAVRLAEILEHIAEGEIEEVIDIYPKPLKPWKLKLALSEAERLLGEAVPGKEATRILNSLGIASTLSGKAIECVVSTFRLDLKTPEDLIEEIGRIMGYDQIKPAILPEMPLSKNDNGFAELERKARNVLADLGFDEIYNYSFHSEKSGIEKAEHYVLENPMNPEQHSVRRSLVPNLLGNVKENLKHFSSFGIFEIGRAYVPGKNGPKEERRLSIAQISESDKDAETFYLLKGACEDFLNRVVPERPSFEPAKDAGEIWHAGRTARIIINGKPVGLIGEVNPAVLGGSKIAKRIAIADLDLECLLAVSGRVKEYDAISRFPVVARDISLMVGRGVSVADIGKAIRKSGGNFLTEAEVFDVFEKDGKKSVAFHLSFSSKERTLENSEIDEAVGKLVSLLEKDFGAEIRK